MPQVPLYKREVGSNLTPTPYKHVQLNGDMFGQNVNAAMGNLGNSAGNFVDAMVKLKDRIDDTKLLEAKNLSSEWVQKNLLDKENGYFYKTGKDAYGGSEALLADYDKTMNDFIEHAGLSPKNKKMAQLSLTQMRQPIMNQMYAHDYKQGVEWSNNVASDSLNNYMTDAINSRNDNNVINNGLSNALKVIEWQGELQHWDKSTVEAKKKAYTENFLENVLNAKLGEGSLSAGEFFEQNKNYFNPDKLASLVGRVKQNELNYSARETALSLTNLSTEEAYKQINSISDAQTREAVERNYNYFTAQQDRVQRDKDNQISNEIMQEVYGLYDSGDYNLGEIMQKVNQADMSLEMKERVYKNLKEMQELENVGNNWADYNYLLDMAAENNEMFLKVNPATYNLNKEQYNKILEMQRSGKDVQFSTEVQLKKAVKELSGFNLVNQRGLSNTEYQQDVIKFLSKLERLQGKAFDLKHIDNGEIANILSNFEYKNENEKNTHIDETKELWMRAKKDGEIYDRVAYQYANFKNQNKREPNAQEMYDMVKRSYNAIETEYKTKALGKVDIITGYKRDIETTTSKPGETKVLTYFADKEVPKIARELGLKLTSVEGSRYRKGDKGGHGYGRKLDISMSEHNNTNRIRIFEAMLANPLVTSIGTSDPLLLKRFKGNTKIRNLTEYDKQYHIKHPNSKMNHIGHIDISLNTNFGGTVQGQDKPNTKNSTPAYMSSPSDKPLYMSSMKDRPKNI